MAGASPREQTAVFERIPPGGESLSQLTTSFFPRANAAEKVVGMAEPIVTRVGIVIRWIMLIPGKIGAVGTGSRNRSGAGSVGPAPGRGILPHTDYDQELLLAHRPRWRNSSKYMDRDFRPVCSACSMPSRDKQPKR